MYDGNLDDLLEQFAPYREIYLELAQPVSKDKLSSYGEVKTVDGRAVCFLVQREMLTRSVSRILADLEVIDLTVTEPAVEDVIRQVFEAGVVTAI
jgi:ABC-2 type transport system ATP-binding protein